MNKKNKKYIEFAIEFLKNVNVFNARNIAAGYIKENEGGFLNFNNNGYRERRNKLTKMYGNYLGMLIGEGCTIPIKRRGCNGGNRYRTSPELLSGLQELLNDKKCMNYYNKRFRKNV